MLSGDALNFVKILYKNQKEPLFVGLCFPGIFYTGAVFWDSLRQFVIHFPIQQSLGEVQLRRLLYGEYTGNVQLTRVS